MTRFLKKLLTYKGCDGYAPIFSYIGAEGYMLSCELRPGTQHCQKHTPAFLQKMLKTIDKIDLSESALIRMDSGNDSKDTLRILMQSNHFFLVKRNLRRENKDKWLAFAQTLGNATYPREGKIVYTGSVTSEHPLLKCENLPAIDQVFKITVRNSDHSGNVNLFPEIDIEVYWTNLYESAQSVIDLYHDYLSLIFYKMWSKLLCMKVMHLFFMILSLFVFLSCKIIVADNPLTFGRRENLQMGISYPTLVDDRDRLQTAQNLSLLNIQLIRFDVTWKYREPEKGTYYWDPLDERVNWAESNGIDIILTIKTSAPSWAVDSEKSSAGSDYISDRDAFALFIRAMVERYSDKVELLQFGNEWDSFYNYAGTAADYVYFNNLVYNTVQEINSDITFALGGISIGGLTGYAWLKGEIENVYINGEAIYDENDFQKVQESDLQQRIEYVFNHAFYDVADIHLYDDPENWLLYYSLIQELTSGQDVIVTEFGGPSEEESHLFSYQTQRFVQYLSAINDLPISKACFFKLTDGHAYHAHSALLTLTGLRKPSWYLMQEFCQ